MTDIVRGSERRSDVFLICSGDLMRLERGRE